MAPRDNPRGDILQEYLETINLQILNEEEPMFLSDRMQK